MFNDGVMPGENIGEKQGGEKRGEYAERWEGAMDDAPEFAGEWGYGEGAPEEVAAETEQPETEMQEEIEGADMALAGASRLTSFGLDTASREYGLEAVLAAIKDTDETGRDAENPMGAIYERLAPDPESRAYLYQEIRRDRTRENRHNDDVAMEDGAGRLGFTRDGEFYEKTDTRANSTHESVEAIRAMRNLMMTLETDERFAELRAKAGAEGKTVIEYLVKDEVKPTLTNLFNSVGDAMSDGAVEEIVAEAEKMNDEIKRDGGAMDGEGADVMNDEGTLNDDNVLKDGGTLQSGGALRNGGALRGDEMSEGDDSLAA